MEEKVYSHKPWFFVVVASNIIEILNSKRETMCQVYSSSDYAYSELADREAKIAEYIVKCVNNYKEEKNGKNY